MRDAAWVLLAIATAGVALLGRYYLLVRFRRNALGRFVAELIGWNGYFLALAIGMIQTNEGWHRARGANVETRSTWSEDGPLFFVIANVLAVLTYGYLEHKGRHLRRN